MSYIQTYQFSCLCLTSIIVFAILTSAFSWIAWLAILIALAIPLKTLGVFAIATLLSRTLLFLFANYLFSQLLILLCILTVLALAYTWITCITTLQAIAIGLCTMIFLTIASYFFFIECLLRAHKSGALFLYRKKWLWNQLWFNFYSTFRSLLLKWYYILWALLGKPLAFISC